MVMQKAILLGEKVHKMVAQLTTPAARISTSISIVIENLEKAELLKNQLSFATKFNKDLVTQKELTDEGFTVLHNTVETVCTKILEETKVIRALAQGGKAL